MILTLLTKMIAVYVRLSEVQVGEPGLERTVTRNLRVYSLTLKERLHAKLRDLLKVLQGKLGDSGRSRQSGGQLRGSSITRGWNSFRWGWSSSTRASSSNGACWRVREEKAESLQRNWGRNRGTFAPDCRSLPRTIIWTLLGGYLDL